MIVFKMATCVQVSGLHSACSFTARPLSSMQNCLNINISSIVNSNLTSKRDILLKFTWGVRISTRPRLVFQGLSGSRPHLEGSWIFEMWVNLMWATNALHGCNLRMVCCIYCCTARVESISSKGSSTHCEKFAVFVPGKRSYTVRPCSLKALKPGRFRLMITVPDVAPSPIFVIITVIDNTTRRSPNPSERRLL